MITFQYPDNGLWKHSMFHFLWHKTCYWVYVKYGIFMSTIHIIDEVLTLTVCTWFEHISMLVILLNCVTLGMFQPCEDISCLSDWCRILQVSWPHTHTFARSLLRCSLQYFQLAYLKKAWAGGHLRNTWVSEFAHVSELSCHEVVMNPFLK